RARACALLASKGGGTTTSAPRAYPGLRLRSLLPPPVFTGYGGNPEGDTMKTLWSGMLAALMLVPAMARADRAERMEKRGERLEHRADALEQRKANAHAATPATPADPTVSPATPAVPAN